jgi:uncharacterized protein (TIGR02145 family)
MKAGIKLLINPMTLMVMALILLTGCKKDNSNFETMADNEGTTYAVVKIGNQVWMAENLRSISFRDGSWMMTELYDGVEWASAGSAATCIYPHSYIDGLNSEADVAEAYGRLYNWSAVHDSRGLCPEGWRVPNDDDWDELIEYLGGEEVAGGKLKSLRTAPIAHPRWESPNTGATNDYNFEGVPSGYRTSLGQFEMVGYYAEWWSSTEYNADLATTRYIGYDDAAMYYGYGRKRAGYPVRCISGN